MENTKAMELCKDFGNKVRDLVLTSLDKELKIYKTSTMKQFVINQYQNDYIEILQLIDKIKEKLDLFYQK